MKLPSSARPHIVSAGMAAVYALLLHLILWAVVTALYVAPYNGIARICLPVAVLILGLIAFFLLRPRAPESVTFLVVLLIVHILLTVLMVATPITDWLTALPADAAVDSPDGNLDSLYLLFVWLLIGPVCGVLFFLFAVIFAVRDWLRSAMGYMPRPKKAHKETRKK